jgi:hypothetical protein
MDVVVRTYTGKGSRELMSLLEERRTEIERMMREIPGLESYTLARSSDGEGGMSMTVCKDKAGIDASVKLAKEWLGTNAAHIGMEPPKVSNGTIIVHAMKR